MLGFRPSPTGGAYSAPPVPLAGFKGDTSKGREGKGRKRKGKGRGERKENGKGRKGKRKGYKFHTSELREVKLRGRIVVNMS